jgi:hypothetical protein
MITWLLGIGMSSFMLYWMDISRLWLASPSFCIVYVGFALFLPFGLAYLDRRSKQHNRKFLAAARAQAQRRFLNILVKSDDVRFEFDGKTAIVLKQEERIQSYRGTMYGYSYTIYAQNSAGQYFMCLIHNDDEKPFVKHMDAATVKAALKEAVAPITLLT